MTEKDYQALAIVLTRSKPARISGLTSLEQWRIDVEAIADHCVLDNPRVFNRQRFIDACNGDR